MFVSLGPCQHVADTACATETRVKFCGAHLSVDLSVDLSKSTAAATDEAAAPPAQIQSNLKEMPTADAAAAAARSRRDPHQDSVMVGEGEWVAIFDPRMGFFITANCKSRSQRMF